MDNHYVHTPVLLAEVITYLRPSAGESFIDATLGGGGYSLAILDKIGSSGHLLSIDLDEDAVENARISNFKFQISNWTIAQGNFARIDHIVRNHKFPAPNGIVADLGFSSYELDQAGRGMSFQKDERLDMRFDLSQPETAEFIINNYDLKQLTKIFRDLGEENFSFQIAKKIIEHRSQTPVKSTAQLYGIIEESLPKKVRHKASDSARRIFQALRIAVNHELENLQTFLPKSFDLLAPGGRMVIVSFHSLEDRIVKQFFVGLTKGCVCPIDFPECICGKNPVGRLLTKKLVTASEEELQKNSRSKPAKLRAIIKL